MLLIHGTALIGVGIWDQRGAVGADCGALRGEGGDRGTLQGHALDHGQRGDGRGGEVGSFGLKVPGDLLTLADDLAVWSIPCFFVRPAYLCSGVMAALIQAAIDVAAAAGASSLEAYPVDTTVPGHTGNLFPGGRAGLLFPRSCWPSVSRSRAGLRPARLPGPSPGASPTVR